MRPHVTENRGEVALVYQLFALLLQLMERIVPVPRLG